MGVHLMGMYLMGMYLMGVHLTDVYFMEVYIPDPPSYKRRSICRDCKIRVFCASCRVVPIARCMRPRFRLRASGQSPPWPQPPLGHHLCSVRRTRQVNRPVTPLKSPSTRFQLLFPRVVLRLGHLGGFFGNYSNSEVSSAFIPNMDLITDPKLAPAFSCGPFSSSPSFLFVIGDLPHKSLYW
jgi:hypothetical protein